VLPLSLQLWCSQAKMNRHHVGDECVRAYFTGDPVKFL
jgi:hypothetical protein